MGKFLSGLKSNKGNIMVLVTISMIILFASMAVAVDAGYLYSEHARLVTAADAAAIAGAYELIDSTNESIEFKAIKIAQANGVAANSASDCITYGASDAVLQDGAEKITVTVDKNNKEVKVTVEQRKDLHFARAIGIKDALISASARAGIGQIESMTGLIPIGIDKETWNKQNPGEEFQIKFTSQNKDDDIIGPGNYCAVDFTHQQHDASYDPNTEGSDYRDYLRDGYQGAVTPGDSIYTEPGVKVGPTKQGISNHVNQIVYAPIICTFLEANGTEKIEVTGFAIIKITNKTSKANIWAEKISDAVVRDPGKNPWTSDNTGIWSAKLVD